MAVWGDGEFGVREGEPVNHDVVDKLVFRELAVEHEELGGDGRNGFECVEGFPGMGM